MAQWHGIKLKAGPEGLDRCDVVDRYSDGHAHEGYEHNSRNEPIPWPMIETGEMQADDIGGTYPILARAQEAIWTGSELRAATVDELAQIEAFDAVQAAEAEAAEIERLNTPIVFDQPIESHGFVFVARDNNIGYEYFVDEDGALLSYIKHASPLKNAAESEALKVAAKAKRKTAKTDWRNNSGKGQLQKRVEALEAAMNELLGGGQ